MEIDTVRATISIIVVSVFLVVTGLIALLPVFFGFELKPFTEHLKTYISAYSGIVGLILGYYFGKTK